MAIILHGSFAEGRLQIWGETPPDRAVLPAMPRGRGPKAMAPPAYPFDPGPETLTAALTANDLPVADGPADRTVLWLPSAHDRPLASSAIIAEPPDQPDGAALRPWSASAVALAPSAVIGFLCRCAGDRVLAPGLFVADDLAFWATAMRFAGALVARETILPDLVIAADGTAAARWRPVLAGRDAAVLAQLGKAMPEACRAAGMGAAPPDRPAARLLTEFLGAMVDALVGQAPLLPPLSPPPAASKPAPAAAGRSRAREPAVPSAAAGSHSVDDRWLAALAGPERAVVAKRDELAQLEQRLRDWRRPIAVTLSSPFRLCFRLEEPDAPEEEPPEPGAAADGAAVGVVSGGDGIWHLRYLVQALHDPSLLVPAPQAWVAKGPVAASFRAGGVDNREFLLLSLGQAARLCPPVAASLKRGIPEGCDIDAAAAIAFLTEHAVGLEQAGFGVMLPAWWTRKGTKLRLAARAKVKSPAMQGGGGLTLEELIKFDWEVALGDQVLSHRDLMALARLKTPLVRVRGQWVLLNAAEIKEAVALLKRREQGLTARDAVRMALGGAGPDGIDPAGVKIEGWIAELLERLRDRAAIEDLPPPAGFAGSLRPYQARGYAWLAFLRRWELGACLADDMGLGKTVQTLTLLQREKEAAAERGEGRPTVLLVCPTSVVGNWQREAARFTPGLSVMVHHGGERTKGGALRRECLKHDLVLTSYALLLRDIEALKPVPWAGVILDEAQNIKNPETKQAKATRSLTGSYRIALTGTPVENNVGDLWSIMEFLNPGFLGTQATFKRSFFLPIQTRRDPDAIERLKSLSGPFILRRLKTDKAIIADLPDKLEMKVYCTLTREQASLYAAVVEESLKAVEEAEGIQRKGIVLATLAKLKQVCNHPAQFLGDNSAIPDRSGKLARLTEMLEEVLAVRERALIFTQFTEMGDIIKRHLEETFGQEVLFLHGGVPKGRRDRMVERFQSPDDGAPPVFLLSLKAGGTGLNLTAANHVFHYDRWWNPAVEDQATDRAFRIGQTRQVEVHKFLCAGTLEDRIDEMIERKKAVAGAVVGTGEDWLTELSTADLRDLLALRQEALAA